MSEMITLVNVAEALGFTDEDEEYLTRNVNYNYVLQFWCYAGHLFLTSRGKEAGEYILESYVSSSRSLTTSFKEKQENPGTTGPAKKLSIICNEIVNLCYFNETKECIFIFFKAGNVLLYFYEEHVWKQSESQLILCSSETTFVSHVLLHTNGGSNVIIWCEKEAAPGNTLCSKINKCNFTVSAETNAASFNVMSTIVVDCPMVKCMLDMERTVVVWPDKPSPPGIFMTVYPSVEVKKIGRGVIFRELRLSGPTSFKQVLVGHMSAWFHDKNSDEMTVVTVYKCLEQLLSLGPDGQVHSIDATNGEDKKLFSVQSCHMADLVTITAILEHVFLAVITKSMIHMYCLDGGEYITSFDITEYGKIYKVFQQGENIKVPMILMGKGVYQLRLRSITDLISSLKVENFHKSMIKMNSVNLGILVALEETYRKKKIFPIEAFLDEGILPLQNSALLLALSQQAIDKEVNKETMCHIEEMFQHLCVLIPERRTKLNLFLKPLIDGYLMLTQAINVNLHFDSHDGN